MRYCPKCDSEYQDDTMRTCPDDGQALLERDAWEAERARQGRSPRSVGRLVAVARLADQFEAQALAEALSDEGIEVTIIMEKGGIVGPITRSAPSMYLLSVAVTDAERASELLMEWRAGLESPEAAEQAEAAATAESGA